MLSIIMIIIAGAFAYVVVSQKRGDRLGQAARRALTADDHLSVRRHRLIIDNPARDEALWYHLAEINLIAVETRGGRRSHDWLFGFGDTVLVYHEKTPGLDEVIDYILDTPPPGTDLTLYGQAMDTTEARTFVLLDRRPT